MLRRPSPATAIALAALFFSLTGVAFAANQYVINSTSQINPKVLKVLKGRVGHVGARGANGAIGAAGAVGATGAAGPPGPFPDTLPSGKTVRGTWAVAGATAAGIPAEDGISFVWNLPARPSVIRVPAGGPVPAGCSGTADHPVAAPGNLCIFVGWSLNSTFASLGTYDGTSAAGTNGVSGFQGITVFAAGTGAGLFEQAGSFAVTAP